MADIESPTDTAAPGAETKKKRQTHVGEVASHNLTTTLSVRVVRIEKHRTYHKYIQRKTIYKAHDEEGQASQGDTVRIAEVRPLS